MLNIKSSKRILPALIICVSAIIASQFSIICIWGIFLIWELATKTSVTTALIIVFVIALAFAKKNKIAFLMLQAIVVYAFVLLCSSGLWVIREKFATDRTFALKDHLESMRAKGLPYPASLANSPDLLMLQNGYLDMDTIKYTCHGSEYTICRYQPPLGPFLCYSSKKQEWFFEE